MNNMVVTQSYEQISHCKLQ